MRSLHCQNHGVADGGLTFVAVTFPCVECRIGYSVDFIHLPVLYLRRCQEVLYTESVYNTC
jgi:hypothetical protein